MIIGSSQLNIKSCSKKTILCVLTKKFNFPIQMITLLISEATLADNGKVLKSLNIDSKFIDFSCILQKSWLLKSKVYRLVFTIDPSTSASTNTTSTTAHISLWKQPWYKHKHKCKLKHKDQNFFLFLVLVVLTAHISLWKCLQCILSFVFTSHIYLMYAIALVLCLCH